MPETATPAAPAATPTPAPTPSPSQSPAPSGSDFEREIASKVYGEEPKPAAPTPAPAATPAAAPKKGEPAKPTTAVKPPEPNPADPKATGPKELREELERVRNEAKTYSQKVADYEAKIAEYERKGKDASALQARLDQIEQEHKAAQGELRALKREASPEFKKQYEEPMREAVEFAKEATLSLVRLDDQKADFDRDFAPIYQMAKQNYGVAAAKAREIFGDDQGPVLMSHVQSILNSERKYNKAFQEEQRGWEERAKQEEGARLQREHQAAAMWEQMNRDLVEKMDDFRDPVDDTELPAQRAAGIKYFDEFNALGRSKNRTPEQQTEFMFRAANIRHRLGAYEAQKLQIARQTAKIAELEAAIEDGKTRQPGDDPRKPGGAPVAAPEVDWDTDLISSVKGR